MTDPGRHTLENTAGPRRGPDDFVGYSPTNSPDNSRFRRFRAKRSPRDAPSAAGLTWQVRGELIGLPKDGRKRGIPGVDNPHRIPPTPPTTHLRGVSSPHRHHAPHPARDVPFRGKRSNAQLSSAVVRQRMPFHPRTLALWDRGSPPRSTTRNALPAPCHVDRGGETHVRRDARIHSGGAHRRGRDPTREHGGTAPATPGEESGTDPRPCQGSGSRIRPQHGE